MQKQLFLACVLSCIATTAIATSAYQTSQPTIYSSSVPDDIDAVIDGLIQHSNIAATTAYHSLYANKNWRYTIQDSDFDDNIYRTATITSIDGNAHLVISYDNNDKNYQNPSIAVMLSGKADSYDWHRLWCISSCPVIDLNVDGNKYQGMKTVNAGDNIVAFLNAKTVLSRIKNGNSIKMRINRGNGDYLYYDFVIEQPFDISHLK
ncbi:hypothetical protein [Moraxella marmotae]|uniref:hypothetical protein n=1 Tax=Moraxella marmotae TaxID=3344520 RepID=UPI0035F42596